MELSMVDLFILFLVFMLGFFVGKMFTTIRYGMEYTRKFEVLEKSYIEKKKKRNKKK
jgi:hypothetical protein